LQYAPHFSFGEPRMKKAWRRSVMADAKSASLLLFGSALAGLAAMRRRAGKHR
jgi:hypothetical protein